MFTIVRNTFKSGSLSRPVCFQGICCTSVRFARYAWKNVHPGSPWNETELLWVLESSDLDLSPNPVITFCVNLSR